MMMRPNAAKIAEYEAVSERWSKIADKQLQDLEAFVESRRNARKREEPEGMGYG
jgi:hypothetical protein